MKKKELESLIKIFFAKTVFFILWITKFKNLAIFLYKKTIQLEIKLEKRKNL